MQTISALTNARIGRVLVAGEEPSALWQWVQQWLHWLLPMTWAQLIWSAQDNLQAVKSTADRVAPHVWSTLPPPEVDWPAPRRFLRRSGPAAPSGGTSLPE